MVERSILIGSKVLDTGKTPEEWVASGGAILFQVKANTRLDLTVKGCFDIQRQKRAFTVRKFSLEYRMSVDDYTLAPSAVASFTQPTPELHRNYRSRGMLEKYGKVDANGRWKYSLRDLVGIWISDCLSLRDFTMDRRKALEIGYNLTYELINEFSNMRLGVEVKTTRFVAYVHKSIAAPGEAFGSHVKKVDDLDLLNDEEFHYLQVFNIAALARDLPEGIQGLLIAALETDD